MTVRGRSLQLVKGTARAWDRVRPPQPGVVFLAYHCVGAGSNLELDVTVETFDRQMEWLAASGRAISIDDGLAALGTEAHATGELPVVVTFDDGTADFAEHAVPVLVRHGIPATIYVATAYPEEQRTFDYGGPAITWSALADAASTELVTVGSHTHSHAVMRTLDAVGADDELRRSQDLIAERIGRPADHFAYPKGVLASNEAEAVVRQRFRSAALAEVGANPYGRTDRYRLRRSPIQSSDGMGDFVAKADGGRRLEGVVRESFNRVRYAKRDR